MQKAKPLIVNMEYEVIGGNQRLAAIHLYRSLRNPSRLGYSKAEYVYNQITPIMAIGITIY